MESKVKIIQMLKGLLTVCRACEQGFRSAAGILHGKTARDLISTCADQHREFAEELRNEIYFHSDEEFDAAPPKDAWHEISKALPSHDDETILNACERMEQALLRIYQDALAMEIPWDVESVLSHQNVEIKNACFFLSALELFSQHQFAM
jgi:uncharacterized protein (TIGR02284 family)